MSQITPVPGPSQADFDALNGKIANLNIINLSTNTSIASLCASCPSGEHRYYGATVSTTFSDFPSEYGTLYHPIVHIVKRVNGCEIIINAVSGTNTPTQINGWFENNTFKWEKLALDSNKANKIIEVDMGTITASSYKQVSYPSGYTQSNAMCVGFYMITSGSHYYNQYGTVTLTSDKISVTNGFQYNSQFIVLLSKR